MNIESPLWRRCYLHLRWYFLILPRVYYMHRAVSDSGQTGKKLKQLLSDIFWQTSCQGASARTEIGYPATQCNVLQCYVLRATCYGEMSRDNGTHQRLCPSSFSLIGSSRFGGFSRITSFSFLGS